MAVDKTKPISILGAGAWGLSTALHLIEAGYTDVTVFDQASEIPSQYSGAYDLNKIVRAEYEDEFYTELALVSGCISRQQGRGLFIERKRTDLVLRKPSTVGKLLSGAQTSIRLDMFLQHQVQRHKRQSTICKRRYSQ